MTVSYNVDNAWTTGHSATVTVSNKTSSTQKDWVLAFNAPFTVTSLWNATVVSYGAPSVKVKAPQWSRDLAPGAQIAFSFVAQGRPTVPTSCSLNGKPCRFTQSEPKNASLSVKVTSDWSSGFTADAVLTNIGSVTWTDWKVQLDSAYKVTSVWNGTSTSTGSTTIADAGWNAVVVPGASVTFGFVAQGLKRPVSVTSCAITGGACKIASGPETPKPPVTVPPVTVPVLPTEPKLIAFSPYVDATNWPTPDLIRTAAAANTRQLTLAFIVNGASRCRASWGQYYDRDSGFMAEQVAALRKWGGDVIMSFGGAANTELALSCTTDQSLADEYQAVIDRYDLKSVDFDIEGAAVWDQASIDRRSKAIALLQARATAAKRPLDVSLTLPVMPWGLTGQGLNVVRSAVQAGVRLASVNIMAMDYGLANASLQMGSWAVQAAVSTQEQLAGVLPGLSSKQLYALVGVIPMIGQNDIAGEVFSLADASLLRKKAVEYGFARLSMWSAARDKPCPGGATLTARDDCSGTNQQIGAFARVLSGS